MQYNVFCQEFFKIFAFQFYPTYNAVLSNNMQSSWASYQPYESWKYRDRARKDLGRSCFRAASSFQGLQTDMSKQVCKKEK